MFCIWIWFKGSCNIASSRKPTLNIKILTVQPCVMTFCALKGYSIYSNSRYRITSSPPIWNHCKPGWRARTWSMSSITIGTESRTEWCYTKLTNIMYLFVNSSSWWQFTQTYHLVFPIYITNLCYLGIMN